MIPRIVDRKHVHKKLSVPRQANLPGMREMGGKIVLAGITCLHVQE